jgi:sec-independent protein translocase protein TatB
MFNIGFSELVILGVIGLLVLGPEQLPVVARKLARILNDLKRAKEEILSPVDDFKRQASDMLENARRQAARLEEEALMNRKLDPHPGDIVTDEATSETPELTQAEKQDKKDE